MSDNVLSYGIMAVLKNPIGDLHTEEWEVKNEALYEEGFSLNYEGTLIFSDEGGSETYGIQLAQPHMFEEFYISMQRLGIEYEEPRFYSCMWYNGSDSDMSMMTKEKFVG